MKYLKYFDKHNIRETFQENNDDGTFIHYCEDQEHLHYLKSEQSIIDTISGGGAYNPYFNQWTMLEYIRNNYGLEVVEKFYSNDENDNDVYTLGNDIDISNVYKFDTYNLSNNVLPINEGNVGLSMSSINGTGFENNINNNVYFSYPYPAKNALNGVWPMIIISDSQTNGEDIESILRDINASNIGPLLSAIYTNGGSLVRLVEICSSNGGPADVAIYMSVNYTDYIFSGLSTPIGGGEKKILRDINPGIETPSSGSIMTVDFPLMYVLVFFENSELTSNGDAVDNLLYTVTFGTNSRVISILPIQQFVHQPYNISLNYDPYYRTRIG